MFLQTEDGCPSNIEIKSFGLLADLAEVREAIAALGNEPHAYQTVVVDSIDALEAPLWAAVCATNNWASIEAPGYGRGYVEADKTWLDLLAGLDWLRRTRGMTVVLLGHSAIETVNDPRAPSYTSYQLRLHKRARALIQDWTDIVAFLATDFVIKSEDAGFARKRVRADGGSHALPALREPSSLHRQEPLRAAGQTAGTARFRFRQQVGAVPSRRLRRTERFPCVQPEEFQS